MTTYIKRGPSVYSFSQLLDNGHEVAQGTFGPTSSVVDLPGRYLPTYRFASQAPLKRRFIRIHSMESLAIVPDVDMESSPGSPPSELSCESWDAGSMSSPHDAPEPPSWAAPNDMTLTETSDKDATLLETVLTALWDDCATNQLFRYDLSACCTRRLSGDIRFVVQLNEGRAINKRPTEFKMDQVCQAFDDTRFNFKKAYVREALLQFEPQELPGPATNLTAVNDFLSPSLLAESSLSESSLCSSNPNLVLINISPIEYGHVLLVPRVFDCLPQLVDSSTMELALHFAKEADSRSFRVGYNSLGAYATINHLHFQAYHLDIPFPCELARTGPIDGVKRQHAAGIMISRVLGFPVNGFVVELERGTPIDTGIPMLADVVARACASMQQLNVPHNLLISDSGRRVFIWPQCFAERCAQGLIPAHLLEMGVNPAAFEISGHILLKRPQDYQSIVEADVTALLEQASLPEQRFLQLAKICF